MKFESPHPSENEKKGNAFLKKRFDLHKTEEIQSAAEKTTRLSGEKVPQNPEHQIQSYIDRLNNILHPEDVTKKERNINLMKQTLHKEFVIQEDNIPESYWGLQRKIAGDRGEAFPDEISPELKAEAYTVLSKDQIESLNYWVDYLTSEDTKDAYPDWAKLWAFKSMLHMSDYDKEKQSFGKRNKTTTGPFPDLNQEALATAIEYIHDIADGNETENPIEAPENEFAEEDKPVSDEDFQKLLSTQNFSKFYAFAIEHVVADTSELWKNTDGEWVKYDQGSDAGILTKTIQGKGTGWCTAGTHTAESQLSQGDFYVYYSQDELGQHKIPRLAIRMQGDSISEVRGVAHKQEIDPYISPVLEEKMDEFGDQGETYKKKAEDMRLLTEINTKVQNGEELTKGDLRCLYELDHEIEGFGYENDPRIEEIRGTREVKEDLANLFDCRPEQISTTEEEALSGDIVYHYGYLDFNSLTSAEGLTLPESVGEGLNLRGLTSVEGLVLPKSVGGNLRLDSLTSAEGLTLPESVGGYLDLSSLTSAEGLVLPESVGGSLSLSLTSAEGLTLPESVGGDLSLGLLTTAEGLIFPKSVGGDLRLGRLTTAEGLTLPESVGGDLKLSGLTSAEGLTLPESVGGDLKLSGLTSAEGLTLPESVGGYLMLAGLTSAKELTLPESVGGGLHLSHLTRVDKEMLRQKYPQHANKM